MSWRDMLEFVNPVNPDPPHNTHNTQNQHKNIKDDNSADIANCAERDSKILEALAGICCGLNISPAEVRDEMSPEDIDDWFNGLINNAVLAAFASLLVQRMEMDQGKVPDHFSELATCKQCGPIHLWLPGKVLACPWCRNRVEGLPIPRPGDVKCINCRSFKRIDHPHLGHCIKGRHEAIAGLWDTDRKYCEWYLPLTES